jgi:hypothetical protein
LTELQELQNGQRRLQLGRRDEPIGTIQQVGYDAFELIPNPSAPNAVVLGTLQDNVTAEDILLQYLPGGKVRRAGFWMCGGDYLDIPNQDRITGGSYATNETEITVYPDLDFGNVSPINATVSGNDEASLVRFLPDFTIEVEARLEKDGDWMEVFGFCDVNVNRFGIGGGVSGILTLEIPNGPGGSSWNMWLNGGPVFVCGLEWHDSSQWSTYVMQLKNDVPLFIVNGFEIGYEQIAPIPERDYGLSNAGVSIASGAESPEFDYTTRADVGFSVRKARFTNRALY